VALSLQALNTRFVPNVLSAPVGATLNITYTNSDAGVSHDVVFFTPSGAEAGRAEIFPGVATRQISFVASVAGVYRFTCSVHPRDMNGVLNVQ
jgi:plastocyanin